MIRTHKPVGHFWSCASYFQQSKPFRAFSHQDCVPPVDDILAVDSADEMAPSDRTTKRRKVEDQSNKFIEGKELFVSSARPRDPFSKAHVPKNTQNLLAEVSKSLDDGESDNSSEVWRDEQIGNAEALQEPTRERDGSKGLNGRSIPATDTVTVPGGENPDEEPGAASPPLSTPQQAQRPKRTRSTKLYTDPEATEEAPQRPAPSRTRKTRAAATDGDGLSKGTATQPAAAKTRSAREKKGSAAASAVQARGKEKKAAKDGRPSPRPKRKSAQRQPAYAESEDEEEGAISGDYMSADEQMSAAEKVTAPFPAQLPLSTSGTSRDDIATQTARFRSSAGYGAYFASTYIADADEDADETQAPGLQQQQPKRTSKPKQREGTASNNSAEKALGKLSSENASQSDLRGRGRSAASTNTQRSEASLSLLEAQSQSGTPVAQTLNVAPPTQWSAMNTPLRSTTLQTHSTLAQSAHEQPPHPQTLQAQPIPLPMAQRPSMLPPPPPSQSAVSKPAPDEKSHTPPPMNEEQASMMGSFSVHEKNFKPSEAALNMLGRGKKFNRNKASGAPSVSNPGRPEGWVPCHPGRGPMTQDNPRRAIDPKLPKGQQKRMTAFRIELNKPKPLYTAVEQSSKDSTPFKYRKKTPTDESLEGQITELEGMGNEANESGGAATATLPDDERATSTLSSVEPSHEMSATAGSPMPDSASGAVPSQASPAPSSEPKAATHSSAQTEPHSKRSKYADLPPIPYAAPPDHPSLLVRQDMKGMKEDPMWGIILHQLDKERQEKAAMEGAESEDSPTLRESKSESARSSPQQSELARSSSAAAPYSPLVNVSPGSSAPAVRPSPGPATKPASRTLFVGRIVKDAQGNNVQETPIPVAQPFRELELNFNDSFGREVNIALNDQLVNTVLKDKGPGESASAMRERLRRELLMSGAVITDTTSQASAAQYYDVNSPAVQRYKTLLNRSASAQDIEQGEKDETRLSQAIEQADERTVAASGPTGYYSVPSGYRPAPSQAWPGTQVLLEQAIQDLAPSPQKEAEPEKIGRRSSGSSELTSLSERSSTEPANGTEKQGSSKQASQENPVSTQQMMQDWEPWSTVKKPRQQVTATKTSGGARSTKSASRSNSREASPVQLACKRPGSANGEQTSKRRGSALRFSMTATEDESPLMSRRSPNSNTPAAGRLSSDTPPRSILKNKSKQASTTSAISSVGNSTNPNLPQESDPASSGNGDTTMEDVGDTIAVITTSGQQQRKPSQAAQNGLEDQSQLSQTVRDVANDVLRNSDMEGVMSQ